MIGEKFKAAGIQFGYHDTHRGVSHYRGRRAVCGGGWMRLTDPSKVTMEMDCGWVVVGGAESGRIPQEIPDAHYDAAREGFQDGRRSRCCSGGRCSRDTFCNASRARCARRPAAPPRRIAELGQGSIDYKPIFDEAAKAGHVTHCFVEQEGFDMPPMDSLKIDADYLRKFVGSEFRNGKAEIGRGTISSLPPLFPSAFRALAPA